MQSIDQQQEKSAVCSISTTSLAMLNAVFESPDIKVTSTRIIFAHCVSSV
ncbi:hypothetical protein [Methylovorus mays]|nr:hypothetical protein [Methylovorus mays]MCB5208199.1 hypothetical protein [Methylovorus mays]